MSAELNLNVLSTAQAYAGSANSALSASQELVGATNGEQGNDLLFAANDDQSGASQAVSTATDIEARGSEASAKKSENEAEQNESKSIIDDVVNTLTGVKDTLLGVVGEIASVVTSIGQKESEKGAIDGQIGALSGDDSDEAQSQRAELQQQSDAIQAEIDKENQAKAELETEQNDLEAEEAKLTTQKTNEENKLTGLETEGAEIDGEIADIQAEGDSETSANQGGEQDANQTEQEAQAELAQAETEEAPAADAAHGEELSQSVPVEEPAPAAPAPAEEEPVNLSNTVQNMEESTPAVQEPAPAPVQEQQPVVQETPVENTDKGHKDEHSIEAVRERIENNEVTDDLMADVIINDYFMGESLEMPAAEILGLEAEDAIDKVAKSFEAKTYSNTVYTSNVSENTDTASFDENQEAISNLHIAFAEASDKVNADGVEFLSLTDKSNYENVSKVVDRLNDGEYILTREIEKTTQTAESIQVSAVETKDTEDQASKVKGEDLLKQLQGEIIEDEEAPEDKNDDVLTQKEYDDMENFFNDTDDIAAAYKQLIEDAQKYGIFATAA